MNHIYFKKDQYISLIPYQNTIWIRYVSDTSTPLLLVSNIKKNFTYVSDIHPRYVVLIWELFCKIL